ncbi:GNAT family N-acetyltransferase [Streptomyces cacaoi]|uniref:GNAT family N-acetyltransferase n=1 Tax=Streptomyces cacaoi TaxID=1898 RepID=UPI00262FC2D0|nr:GNAT family N-acetyltransferase [Streptomyces cacaoi]
MNLENDSAPGASVRPRLATDIEEAARVLVEVHATDGYPVEGVDAPEEWLTPSGAIQSWVAELDGRIVGHVTISNPQDEGAISLWSQTAKHDDVAVLGRLFVLRSARGQAIGKRLIKIATEFACRNNQRLVLDVMAKDASAIRLYEALGWRRIGRVEHDGGGGNRFEAFCYVSPPCP